MSQADVSKSKRKSVTFSEVTLEKEENKAALTMSTRGRKRKDVSKESEESKPNDVDSVTERSMVAMDKRLSAVVEPPTKKARGRPKRSVKDNEKSFEASVEEKSEVKKKDDIVINKEFEIQEADGKKEEAGSVELPSSLKKTRGRPKKNSNSNSVQNSAEKSAEKGEAKKEIEADSNEISCKSEKEGLTQVSAMNSRGRGKRTSNTVVTTSAEKSIEETKVETVTVSNEATRETKQESVDILTKKTRGRPKSSPKTETTKAAVESIEGSKTNENDESINE